MKPNSTLRSFLAIASSSVLAISYTHAATITWDGSASATWSDAANWDTDPLAPDDSLLTDIANFNLATYGANPVFAPNAGTTRINGITIGALNGAMTLTTTNLSIGDGGISIANGAGAFTITGGLTLGAAQSWLNDSLSLFSVGGGTVDNGGFLLTLGGTGDTSISSDIIGSGGLTKIDGGILTLSNTNTYTGATTISAGTLQLDGSTHASSTVDIGTAGTLTGTGTVNGNATLTGNGIINKASGTIAGTLGVTGGNWNGAGSVNGLVTSSSGTFTIGNGANLTANGNLNVTGGTIAAGNATSTITGSVNYTSGTGSSFAGIIAGSGKTLTLNNASATLTLSNSSNSYTGGTSLNAGTLSFVSGALGTTGNITFTGNSTLQWASLNTQDLSARLVMSNGVTSSFDTNGNTVVFANAIGSSSTGALTKVGLGTLRFNSVPTYTGTTTINSGTVEIRAGTAGGSAVWGSGPITLGQGAQLFLNPTNQAVQNTGGFTVGGAITLSGGAGTSTLRFAGNDNKFVLSGGITGQAGVVQTLAISQGVFNGNGDRMTTQFTGPIADGVGGTLGVSVDFAGATGTGQRSYANLSGQNTFTGNLTITNSQGLNGGGTHPGAWLTIGGLRHDSFNVGTLVQQGTGYLGSGADYSGNISISNGTGGLTTLGFLSSVTNQILRGVISGTGSLHQGGSGTLTLTNANTFSGTTTVSAGTIAITNALALQNSAYNTTGSNGTTIGLNVTSGLNSGTLTLGGLAGSVNLTSAFTAGFTGTVTNLTLNPQSGASNTYSGNIANGSMTVTKTGLGTQIFSGGSIAYSGTTAINQGTLRLTSAGSASYTGAITVNATGTLALNGANWALRPVVNLNGGTLLTDENGGYVITSGVVNVTLDSILQTSGTGTTGFNSQLFLDGGLNIASGKTLTYNPANLNSGIVLRANASSSGSLVISGVGTTSNAGRANLQFATNGASNFANTDLTLTNATMNIGVGTNGSDTNALGATIKSLNGNGRVWSDTTANTLTVGANNGTGSFSGVLANGTATLSLTKTGSGTQTLSGTNTYTGTTTVNVGTLSLDYGTNNNTKLSDTAALILGGGTVNLAGATGSHLELVSATTLTAGTGSYVTRTGLNTAVLQMETITNNTGILNFGAENIATANNLNSATTGIIGTWATVGGDWAINSGSNTSGGLTVVGVGVADGFIRAYTAYTDVTRLESGTKVIPNTSTANVRITEGTGVSPANITLAAGTTSINTLNQSTSGGTSAATVNLASQALRTDGILMGPNAGALTIGVAGGTAGTLSSTAATGSIIVTNNSATSLTINSVIANNTTTSLVKTGTGVLVLTGLNTYTGGTTLLDGTIRVGATVGASNTNGILGGVFNTGLTMANKATAVFDVNGHTAFIKDLSGGGSLGGNVTLGSGTLFLTNASNVGNPYGGIISGTTGNVTSATSASWNTTGAHTYTGITTAQGGLWITNILADGGIASGIGQSSSDAGNLVINTGVVSYSSTAAASTNRQFTLLGSGGFAVESTGAITWSYTGAMTYSGAGTKTLNFSRNGTGLGTLAADIDDNTIGGSAAISVSKSGTSNWTLTNAGSAFTGAITLSATTASAGTLAYASAGGANAINFSGITTGSATLSYTGAGQTMSGLIQANALSTGAITLDASGTGAINYSNTGSLGVGGASGAKGLVLSGTNLGNNTLAGGWSNNTLGGAATLTKNGAGTWILTNTNGYTGATAINLGTLRAGAAAGGQAFGSGSAITLANAVAALDLNGFNQTIGSLAGGGVSGGNVTLGANATLTTGGNNSNTSFAGVISGTGTSGLTKTGTGTLTLTGTNTYTGATTVNAGRITLGNGGNLGATALAVNLGGTFAVAQNASATSNAITGSLTLNSGSVFTMADTFASTLNLTGASTLAPTSGTGVISPLLTFDIVGAATDTLAIAGIATVGTAGAKITIAPSTTAITPGNYTVISGAATSNLNANLSLVSGFLPNAGGLYTLSLGSSTATAAIVTVAADANALYWKGAGTAWNTPGNWTTNQAGTVVSGSAPASTTNVAFSAATPGNLTTNTLTAPLAVNSVNFLAGAAIVTVASSANALTINGGGITNGSANAMTINNPVTLGAAQTWTNTGAGLLTIGGAITNGANLLTVAGAGNIMISSVLGAGATPTGGLTMNGTGTLTLATGANTYSGGTTISAGVLAVGLNLGGVNGDNISPDGTSTSLGSGAVSVAAGAALHINTAGLTIANNITLNGLSYGINSGGPAATNAGFWNGAIMANSKTGVTSNTFSGTITLNATSNVSTNWNDKTMIITGKVTGAGGLVIDNSAPNNRRGSLIRLSNTTNDYVGDTTINNGNTQGAQPTLILGASNVIPNGAGKGNVSVLGNLDLNSFSDTINGLSGSGVITSGVAGTPTLTVGDNNATGFTFSGIIQNGSGTVALTKIGSGTQTLSGTNTYTGGTTISGGILNVANVRGLGTSGTLSINAASTTRLSTDTAFGSGGNPVYNVLMFGGGSYTGTIELNRATAGAVTGITHNFGTLTMTLNGGGLGQLNVTAGANAPTGGALDTIAFTSMNAGNNNTTTETLNPTGGNITIGTLTAAGNQPVTIALSGTTAGNAITGVIGGTGNQNLVAITKSGASTWTLSGAGANTYSGTTTVSRGILALNKTAGVNAIAGAVALGDGATTAGNDILRLDASNQIADAAVITFNAATGANAGIFRLNNQSETVAGIASTGGGGIIENESGSASTGTLTVNNSAPQSFSGVIRDGDGTGTDGTLALTKDGSATLTLSGANTYTGATNVNGGTLMLGDGTANTGNLGATAAISVATNATLAVNRTGATTQATDLNGKIISGAGGFSQIGGGTTTLSLANDYTGATNVNAGTLAINGNQNAATGAVTVAAGATDATAVRLKGTGTVGGNTSFAADPNLTGTDVGGIHSPGNSVGTQTFDQFGSGVTNLAYNAGSIFEWELATAPAETSISVDLPGAYASNRGTGYDAVNVTGTLSGSDAIFRVVLDASQNFTEAFWDTDRTWSDIFRTGDGSGTSNVSYASIFGGGFQYYNYSGAGTTLASLSAPTAEGSFNLTGNTLSWSAVPEPSTALAGLLLGAGLLRRRRQGYDGQGRRRK